jgi:hypothetical protein
MAISRPFLLALLGVALLGATFLAVQNARNEASGDAAPAASQPAEQQAAAPAEPAPAASPEELLQASFQGGDVESTAFTAGLAIDAAGERGAVELSGAFEQGAANDVPEFEISAVVRGGGERFEGGFTSLGDEAYFTRGDAGWRVPDEVWSPLVEAVENGAGAQQQQALPLAVDPQSWVRRVDSEGTETVDGVETTRVSAELDPVAVARDMLGLMRAGGQRMPDAREITREVKSAGFDVWIGNDDHVARRFEADVSFRGSGELSFDFELTGVNQPQDIEAPADVRTGMPGGLFGAFAEGVTAGITGFGGGESLSLAALTSPNPGRAARAVAKGKKVLILFQNPEGLDDREMRRVVRAVDARTRALVLTDHVDAVDRYGKMVEDLGVAQTPAVVLIDSRGSARLIEGYVDADTLAQAVADAR